MLKEGRIDKQAYISLPLSCKSKHFRFVSRETIEFFAKNNQIPGFYPDLCVIILTFLFTDDCFTWNIYIIQKQPGLKQICSDPPCSAVCSYVFAYWFLFTPFLPILLLFCSLLLSFCFLFAFTTPFLTSVVDYLFHVKQNRWQNP